MAAVVEVVEVHVHRALINRPVTADQVIVYPMAIQTAVMALTALRQIQFVVGIHVSRRVRVPLDIIAPLVGI